MVPHPLYDINSSTDENDIMLVRLAEPAKNTKPARLLTLEEAYLLESPGYNLSVAGWGSLEEKTDVVPTLRHVEVQRASRTFRR